MRRRVRWCFYGNNRALGPTLRVEAPMGSPEGCPMNSYDSLCNVPVNHWIRWLQALETSDKQRTMRKEFTHWSQCSADWCQVTKKVRIEQPCSVSANRTPFRFQMLQFGVCFWNRGGTNPGVHFKCRFCSSIGIGLVLRWWFWDSELLILSFAICFSKVTALKRHGVEVWQWSGNF